MGDDMLGAAASGLWQARDRGERFASVCAGVLCATFAAASRWACCFLMSRGSLWLPTGRGVYRASGEQPKYGVTGVGLRSVSAFSCHKLSLNFMFQAHSVLHAGLSQVHPHQCPSPRHIGLANLSPTHIALQSRSLITQAVCPYLMTPPWAAGVLAGCWAQGAAKRGAGVFVFPGVLAGPGKGSASSRRGLASRESR